MKRTEMLEEMSSTDLCSLPQWNRRIHDECCWSGSCSLNQESRLEKGDPASESLCPWGAVGSSGDGGVGRHRQAAEERWWVT